MPLLTTATLTGALGWVNVKDHGARGDGVTDDTAAITSAIASLPSTGGVLYFPAGTYVTTGGFTISTPCIIRGDGMADVQQHFGAVTSTVVSSTVTCTSRTAILFTVNAVWARFEHIVLKNTATLSPTTGSGIFVTNSTWLGQKVDYESILVSGFYTNIDVGVGVGWVMHGCSLNNPVTYGIRIRNTINIDGGDWCISDSFFIADTRTTGDSAAAIRIESSGGGKVTNSKINTATGAQRFGIGIDLQPTATGTSDLIIHGVSIENLAGAFQAGIYLRPDTGITYPYVHIIGVQGQGMGTLIASNPVDVGGISYLIIADIVANTIGTPISITNTQNAVISNVVSALAGSPTSIGAGNTNVIDLTTLTPGKIDVMTYAATTTLTISNAQTHKTTTVNATGNATINASGAGLPGQTMTVLIVNDATSGKVITFGTNFRANGTLTGTASKAASVSFVSDGTSWFETGRQTGL